jgi:fumarate reductase subunit D
MDNETEKPQETTSQNPMPEEKKTKTENLAMGILSYLFILCLIPFFTKKDDEFVYFHAKQGLVLCGTEIAAWIIMSIITAILISSWSIFLLSLWRIISTLVSLGFTALSIIGIIYVVQGEKKNLPLIGKLSDLIKF